MDQAQADLEKRKADMDRAQPLYQNQYISAQDWDSARTAYEMALANHQKNKENYALVVEGPRQEEIDQPGRNSSKPRPACGWPAPVEYRWTS